ncbi:MAG: MBL fold metallo-hydrolase [Lachnospiraceae bacterium]|nr:MBL fold metallo-hydrolase [Lachnospiraceae bacterium]
MKVTALIENTTKGNMKVEHGLSLYIETARHKILFDTGQSTLFLENAKALGVDLSQVDICILSHGHYDHGGGLKAFTEVNDHAPIYMNRYAFDEHYHGPTRYIGLNRAWLADEEFMKRIIFTDGDVEIDEELRLLSPRKEHRVEIDSDGLIMREGDTYLLEDFRHEHYLEVSQQQYKFLISGCSHQGILNIMEWFHPDILIGGFHFMRHALDDTLLDLAKGLNEFHTTYYTCHCTGVEQYDFIQPQIEHLHYLAEGDSIEV